MYRGQVAGDSGSRDVRTAFQEDILTATVTSVILSYQLVIFHRAEQSTGGGNLDSHSRGNAEGKVQRAASPRETTSPADQQQLPPTDMSSEVP